MRVANASVSWTSVVAKSECVPQTWGEIIGDNALKLKDTQKSGLYKNWLDPQDASTFYYSLPANPRGREKKIVDFILQNIRNFVVVHLFSTPGSRNEYYGEWVVQQFTPPPSAGRPARLTLRRLALQNETLTSFYSTVAQSFRSRSESRHADLLAELFPHDEGYVVRHEPETLLDLHQPSVMGGKFQSTHDMSQTYTCDFVVSHRKGTFRLCVESKFDIHGITDEAMLKCRFLRDRMHQRVVIFYGDKCYDFGEMEEGGEAKVDLRTFVEHIKL